MWTGPHLTRPFSFLRRSAAGLTPSRSTPAAAGHRNSHDYGAISVRIPTAPFVGTCEKRTVRSAQMRFASGGRQQAVLVVVHAHGRGHDCRRGPRACARSEAVRVVCGQLRLD